MPNPTIAESSFSHVINAPIERVDIANWLLHLPNAEYQRCCPPAGWPGRGPGASHERAA
jgi:hypothetical protein